eukprot:scaffold69809_cov52-Phaeocystis_antarctica.AAC.2
MSYQHGAWAPGSKRNTILDSQRTRVSAHKRAGDPGRPTKYLEGCRASRADRLVDRDRQGGCWQEGAGCVGCGGGPSNVSGESLV